MDPSLKKWRPARDCYCLATIRLLCCLLSCLVCCIHWWNTEVVAAASDSTPEVTSGTDYSSFFRVEFPSDPQLQVYLRRSRFATCTSRLAGRCGARFDVSHGGSAARAALLATSRQLSDTGTLPRSIFATAEIGGDDAIISLQHRAADLARLFEKIITCLDTAPAEETCRRAIVNLSEYRSDRSDPCHCLIDCSCLPRQRIESRIIEALDPLPARSRRSGCPRRVETLDAKQVAAWRSRHLHRHSTVLMLETDQPLHRPEVREALFRLLRRQLQRVAPSRTRPSDPFDDVEAGSRCKALVAIPGCWQQSEERVTAGWIADRASPASSLPLLDPRVEIWHEPIMSGEEAQIALLRLLSRRAMGRMESASRHGNRIPRPVLAILRRNDPPPRAVVPLSRRVEPIIVSIGVSLQELVDPRPSFLSDAQRRSGPR